MDGWAETRTVDEQIEFWQEEIVEIEAGITRLRAHQVVLIRQLDRYQVDTGDGARTMGDWTSARLDLSRQTASRLTQLAHADDSEIDWAMVEGKWGLDRAAALVKLRHGGFNGEEFADMAENYSLGRLYGLLDRLRHLTPADEEDVFEYRYLVIQPSLDESVFKLWGALPGTDGRIIEKALTRRETEFPVLPGQGQGQRRADALTSICLDSLTGGTEQGTETGRAVTVAEVFIDATLASQSFGEQGATVSSGPRVGPNTLSEILCTGRVRVIVTDGLHPVAYTDLGEAIPGRSAATCNGGTRTNVRSKDATAVTGSNPTTSANANMAATTTPTTSPPCAGFITTSPSTDTATKSTPIPHPPPPTTQTPKPRTAGAGLAHG